MPLGFTPGITAYSLFLNVHCRQEKVGLTYGKAHAEGNISYCIHAAIDWYVTQIYKVTHNWHHGRIHHSWSGGKEKHFRKILPFFFFPLLNVLAKSVLQRDAKATKRCLFFNKQKDVCKSRLYYPCFLWSLLCLRSCMDMHRHVWTCIDMYMWHMYKSADQPSTKTQARSPSACVLQHKQSSHITLEGLGILSW